MISKSGTTTKIKHKSNTQTGIAGASDVRYVHTDTFSDDIYHIEYATNILMLGLEY